MQHIRIVLVKPEGSRNIGSIARVIKNFGISNLYLIQPKRDILSQSARDMAVHAVDLLEKAHVVSNLEEALGDCDLVIATTAKERSLPTPLNPAFHSLQQVSQYQQVAILFGPESRGLSNEELNYAHEWIRIPTSPEYPVLNLAQAVGICCYQLFMFQNQQTTPTPKKEEKTKDQPASMIEIHQYIEQLTDYLVHIRFLQPATVKDRMEKFQRLIIRSHPKKREIAMLRGIVSHSRWAIRNMKE